VAELFGVDRTKIAASTSLGDLRADELDFVELVMELEDHFHIAIPDDTAERLLGTDNWQQGMKTVTMAKFASVVEELKQTSKGENRQAPQVTQSPLKRLPEIRSENDEVGFADLTFAIRSHEVLRDGSQRLEAVGIHLGQEVGVLVMLGPKWKKGSLDTKLPWVTFQCFVAYQSLGPKSDALIRIIDELYGTEIRPVGFRKETVFTGISLEGQPAALAKGPTKIKLFYESEDEDRYAELYTNIDLAKGVLKIR
jgi:acyl carrier protein